MQMDTPPETEDRTTTAEVHWPSVLQLVFSLTAAVGLSLTTVFFTLIGATQLLSYTGLADASASTFLLAAGTGLGSVLLLPSAWYAFRRLSHRPAGGQVRWEWRGSWALTSGLLGVLLLLVVLLGDLVSTNESWSWLVLPPLHILAVGLPVLWLVNTGRRGLPSGSPQRFWGILGCGLALSPALVLFLELAALATIGVMGIIVIASRPDLAREITMLSQRLRYAIPTEEVLLRILGPYILRPEVVLGVFTYLAVLVPLIEEALKPVGMWLLAGRGLTPAEGYVAGLLSGAGFTLFETLGSASIGGETWLVQVVTRMGTALVHIFTSGLVGWALATAWKEKRYLRLGVAYLAAVTLHGVWNAMALLGVATLDLPESLSIPPLFQRLGTASMVGLGLMVPLLFGLLVGFNRRLKRAIIR